MENSIRRHTSGHGMQNEQWPTVIVGGQEIIIRKSGTARALRGGGHVVVVEKTCRNAARNRQNITDHHYFVWGWFATLYALIPGSGWDYRVTKKYLRPGRDLIRGNGLD